MKSWAQAAAARVTDNRTRDEEYERHIFADTKCEVRWGNTGRILVALEPIAAGTVIWKETPAVSIQSFPNLSSVASCGRCFTAIGTVEQQLRLATGVQDVPSLLGAAEETPCGPAHSVPCSGGCSIQYCSEKCASDDWKSNHCLLCVGPLTDASHALLRFKTFCMEHNEIFLMAAKVYAKLLLVHAADPSGVTDSVDDVSWPFSLFLRKRWEDAAVYMEDLDDDARSHPDVLEYASELAGPELVSQAAEAFDLLKSALCSPDVTCRSKGVEEGLCHFFLSGYDDMPNHEQHLQVAKRVFSVLDAVFFRELIGLFEINTSAISFFGPVYQVLHNRKRVTLEQRGRAEEILQEFITNLPVNENDSGSDCGSECESEGEGQGTAEHTHDGDVCERLPSFEGIGIFERVAVMNHSCDPNCVTQFGGDWVAEVVSTRNIEPGDEVAHSYIGKIKTYRERKQLLRLWGFTCVCTACNEQRDLL